MAVLWIHHEREQGWCPVPLNGVAVALGEASPPPGAAGVDAPVLMLSVADGAESVLMSGVGAAPSINGDPLALGIRVLRDHDAIRIGSSDSMFFTTESLAQVVPFPEPRPVPCARCKTDITPGSPAVKCPKCGAWHHQGEELSCWTYAEKCAGCDQPTAMDGQYAWTPEGL